MIAKKAASIALVAAMLAGMSVNAFASPDAGAPGAQPTGNAVNLTGKLDADALKINVTLPTTNALTLDPYMVDADNDEGKQIFTEEMVFTNNGEVAVAINFSGYNVNDLGAADAASGITLAKSAIDSSNPALKPAKEVYLYLATPGSDNKYPKSQENVSLVLSEMNSAKYNPDDASSVTALRTPVTLSAEKGLAKDADLKLKLLGDMNVNGAWAAEDTLNVTAIFDIKPVFSSQTTPTPPGP